VTAAIVFRRALSLAWCRNDISMAIVLGHPIDKVPMAICRLIEYIRDAMNLTQMMGKQCSSFDALALACCSRY